MSRNYSRANRSRNRWITLGWIGGLALVVVILMMLKMVALLYVLSTLGVTVLLVMVAMADLRGAQADRSSLRDDSSTIGARNTSITGR
jgi:O-antigen ligase